MLLHGRTILRARLDISLTLRFHWRLLQVLTPVQLTGAAITLGAVTLLNLKASHEAEKSEDGA